MTKHRNDAFSQLLDWLENGDSALETEMEDALKEEAADLQKTVEKAAEKE